MILCVSYGLKYGCRLGLVAIGVACDFMWVSSLANPYGVCVVMLYGGYLMSVDMV